MNRGLGKHVAVATLLAVCVAAVSLGSAHAARDDTTASCTAPAVTVQQWVGAWKAKNFKRMAELSQVSWRLRSYGAVQELRNSYDFKDVLSYRYVRCNASAVSARVTFRVKYRTFKTSHVQITAMVIREGKRGNLSAVGRWGVNPISTLREDPVR